MTFSLWIGFFVSACYVITLLCSLSTTLYTLLWIDPKNKLNLLWLLPLHSGSGLSVSSLLKMHRVIRKPWMDRPTFRKIAGGQCSLNTPLCRQFAGKQYQRGGWTWGRGFHIAPRCLRPWWESSFTLAVSLPLITVTVGKPFMGNVQKLWVCVMCIHECYLLAESPLQNFFFVFLPGSQSL